MSPFKETEMISGNVGSEFLDNMLIILLFNVNVIIFYTSKNLAVKTDKNRLLWLTHLPLVYLSFPSLFQSNNFLLNLFIIRQVRLSHPRMLCNFRQTNALVGVFQEHFCKQVFEFCGNFGFFGKGILIVLAKSLVFWTV